MSFTGIILAGGRGSRFGFDKLKIRVGSVPLVIDKIFKLSFFCDEIIISTSKKHYPFISLETGKIDSYKEIYNFDDIEAIRPGGTEHKFNVFLKRLSQPLNIKIVLDEYNFKNMDIKSPLDKANTGNIEAEPVHAYRKCGPIIGIYSGLINAANPYSLIIAFDMPFISYKLLKFLTGEPGGADTGNKSIVLPSKKQSHSGKKDARIIKGEKGFEVLCGLYSKKCTGVLEKNIQIRNYKISDIFNYLDTEIIESEKIWSPQFDNLNFFNINRVEDYYKFKNIWNNKQNEKNPGKKGKSFAHTWNYFFFR